MTKGQGFGFGLGKIKELQEAFKKAQQFQENAQTVQQELEESRVEGTSSDGGVTVYMNGSQRPISVTITAEAAAKGAESLSQLVTEAMIDAYENSSEVMKEKMNEITSGLELPGF
jgi:DNA-binding YbaB/EbfC family protein